MMNRYTAHAIDHNRGLIAPVRASHFVASLFRSRRFSYTAIAALFVVLLPIDLWLSDSLKEFNQSLGGDIRREINLVQQFGGPTSIVLVAYLMFRLDASKRRRIWDLLMTMAATAAVSTCLKVLIGRIRPRFNIGEPYVFLGPFRSHHTSVSEAPLHSWNLLTPGASQLQSMPSSHTSAAFAIATFIAIVYPRVRVLVYVLAVIVGISRVLHGAHWPTDVLAGALVGYWIAKIVVRRRLGQAVIDKLTPRADRPSTAG
ncbi:MAG: phosphatase PAP2 family protein [Phycisphaerales bacterium JB061]